MILAFVMVLTIAQGRRTRKIHRRLARQAHHITFTGAPHRKFAAFSFPLDPGSAPRSSFSVRETPSTTLLIGREADKGELYVMVPGEDRVHVVTADVLEKALALIEGARSDQPKGE